MTAHLVIDGKYLCYCALYSHSGLSLLGRPIGVVFGAFQQLLAHLKTLRPASVWVAWDAPTESLYRTGLHPDYKATRGDPASTVLKSREDFHGQVRELEDLFRRVGVAQDEIAGLEADDLIALYCRRNRDPVTVFASDNDLFQLLDSHVTLIGRKQKWNADRLRAKYGCEPGEWVTVKALAGCDGDNVPGVKGVGPKTAVKILRGQHKTTLSDYKSVIDRNLQLVKLPFPLVSYRQLELSPPTPLEKVDWEAMLDIFWELDFRSLMDRAVELQDHYSPRRDVARRP
jgi:5'-3' exonuclease